MRAIAQTTTLTWDGRDNEDAKSQMKTATMMGAHGVAAVNERHSI